MVMLLLFILIHFLWFLYLLLLGPFIFVIILSVYLKIPSWKAKSRAKKIDTYIFYAVNYLATMSASGIAPLETLRKLANNSIYGEISKEMALVVRNTDLLGMDLYSALKDISEITPSERFREFIQGFIATVNSGGNVTKYFLKRLEQYGEEEKIINQETIESTGMLSEIFVVVAVAFPLFMTVILVVMALAAGGDQGTYMANQLYLISLVLLPTIFFTFWMLLQSNQVGVE